MSRTVKKSRCAFVVIKLMIEGETFLLMRRDRKWGDLNHLGGHERPQDSGKLSRAARRELLEEMPPLRAGKSFELVPVTGQISYGPIESRSAGCQVEYELQFFLVKFTTHPRAIFEALGRRSDNVFIREDELLAPTTHKVSGLVGVLNSGLEGGLGSLPYSWPDDVGSGLPGLAQMELPFAQGQ